MAVLIPQASAEEKSKRMSTPLPETWQVYQEKYPSISLFDLKSAIDTGIVTLIDANKPETYRKNHIPGAFSLPALIASNGDKSPLPSNKNRMIVVYCGGPQCTSWFKAADYASKQGYKNIRHYSGGLKEWRQSQDMPEKQL